MPNLPKYVVTICDQLGIIEEVEFDVKQNALIFVQGINYGYNKAYKGCFAYVTEVIKGGK